jgi:ABC-2 type transport system permease protein
MAGMLAICRKELADHLGSKRFLLLAGLIIVLSLLSAYQGSEYVREGSQRAFIEVISGNMNYSLAEIMFYFGPIIGLSLGFDAINRERTRGSMSVLLSQPIFRDSIINGKFLAGVGALSLVAISTIGITTGASIPLVGFGPGGEEVIRILIFAGVTVLYLSVWLAIGMLFSTYIPKATNSILASISVWIFSVTIITIFASLVSTALVPASMPQGDIIFVGERNFNGTMSVPPINQDEMQEYIEKMELRNGIRTTISRLSPATLYEEAINVILADPNPPVFSPISGGSPDSITIIDGFERNTDITTVWPQITVLAVVLVACFAASYMLFLRQEIRAGGD